MKSGIYQIINTITNDLYIGSSINLKYRKNRHSKDLRKGITKIYLNGGKNKKIRPGDIVGAICEIDGVTVDDIGVIQVQDHQSYVDILNDKGKLVLKNLKTIKGKTLRIQKAKNGFGH